MSPSASDILLILSVIAGGVTGLVNLVKTLLLLWPTFAAKVPAQVQSIVYQSIALVSAYAAIVVATLGGILVLPTTSIAPALLYLILAFPTALGGNGINAVITWLLSRAIPMAVTAQDVSAPSVPPGLPWVTPYDVYRSENARVDAAAKKKAA